MFVAEENIFCTIKWPCLIAKIGKTKNQSMVGLTLGLGLKKKTFRTLKRVLTKLFRRHCFLMSPLESNRFIRSHQMGRRHAKKHLRTAVLKLGLPARLKLEKPCR